MKTLKNRYQESSEEDIQYKNFIIELNKLDDDSLDEVSIKNIKKSVAQRYKELSRRMKKIAGLAITKLKKKRAQTRKRDAASLLKSSQKQAKMMIIKKQLGPDIKYNELPIQKRIQINQQIVAKKKKVIDKLSKKILRKLKASEGERVAKAKQRAKDALS